MDQRLDTCGSGGGRDIIRAVGLHRGKLLRSTFSQNAHQVDDLIRAGDRRLHGFHIADVRLNRRYLPDIAHRFEEQGRLWIADGDTALIASSRK